MPLPHDYTERIYAGVLGKLIGVYLGRPFEGWTYEHIMAELGEINGYVHEQFNQPLIVSDDDIAGTFTFLRALPDHGNDPHLTAAQIGQTWLNYIIEERTILWWGGAGNSTEHTAFLNLKRGIDAPQSGSIATNGKLVAEQIGAQIFIDGWAMVAAGDPDLAADLARRAASVSHDGEAIFAAQVLAAMEALAFVESDLDTLIDTALSFIPKDSIIYRLIDDVRTWHAAESDWRVTRARIESQYGYDRYGGVCHVVPNHALIILSLLYGEDNFQKSLMVVNTSGWDTDCNSGNVGCLLGIKNGLRGIDADLDWRTPVADRLYLSSADGGRAISDALIETYHIVNTARAMNGLEPSAPKSGARFHFELPGAVQGFQAEDESIKIENVAGYSHYGERSLAICYDLVAHRAARLSTPTFIPPEAIDMRGYELLACPTLYAGQTVRAGIVADAANDDALMCRLFIHTYNADNLLSTTSGPLIKLNPAQEYKLTWRIPDLAGQPIAAVGLELSSAQTSTGNIYLDYLTWGGAPDTQLSPRTESGSMQQRAWIDAVSGFEINNSLYHIMQDEGTGLLMQGTREWIDYRLSAEITPHRCKACGIGAYAQGLHRYYALLLCDDDKIRLIKVLDDEIVLAEADFAWQVDNAYTLQLQLKGTRLNAWIDERLLFDLDDPDDSLDGGGIALVCIDGSMTSGTLSIQSTSRLADKTD